MNPGVNNSCPSVPFSREGGLTTPWLRLDRLRTAAERRIHLTPTNPQSTFLLYSMFCVTFLMVLLTTEFRFLKSSNSPRLAIEGEIRTHAPPRTIAFLLRYTYKTAHNYFSAPFPVRLLSHIGGRGWIRTNKYGLLKPNN